MKLFLWIVCVVSLFTSSALAVPSCTDWMKQNDGSYFRTCVDDSGKQYCESSYKGHISRVSCF